MFLDTIKTYAGSLLVRLLRAYTPAIVAAIPSKSLAESARRTLVRVEQMIAAVTDEDPKDAEQLQAIVARFVSEDAVPMVDSVVAEKLALIQDDRVRRGLTILSIPVVDSLRFLTDDNPNNSAQAEGVFDDFITDPAAQDFLINDLLVRMIEARVPNPMLRAIILETLIAGIKEGAEDLAAVDVFIKDAEAAKLQADKEEGTL